MDCPSSPLWHPCPWDILLQARSSEVKQRIWPVAMSPQNSQPRKWTKTKIQTPMTWKSYSGDLKEVQFLKWNSERSWWCFMLMSQMKIHIQRKLFPELLTKNWHWTTLEHCVWCKLSFLYHWSGYVLIWGEERGKLTIYPHRSTVRQKWYGSHQVSG